MKKIIPTIGMALLGLSAVASSSFAWFSMNKTVTATGMSVKARAEGGIQIKRTKVSTDPSDTATSSSSTAALLPTSTADATKWSHAEGTAENNGVGIESSYTALDINDTEPTDTAIGTGKATADSSLSYYVYDSYTVSSDKNSGNFKNLYVSEVSVGTTNPQALSKSLRVLIKTTDKTLITCPVAGATTSYTFHENASDTTGTAVTAYDYSGSKTTAIGKDTYNVIEDDASSVEVLVYVYFEGEDANSKTANIDTTLDELSVTVKFTAESIAAK